MSVNEIFKTEFKGYNKKEVAEYIMTLNSQAEALKAELERCESELEICKSELSERAEVSSQPSEEAENAMREQLREELYSEIYAKVREELEAEFKANETQDASLDEIREKARMYDEQKDLLAEVMIKAKTDAAEIYRDAEGKSKQLLLDTIDKFEKLSSDFDEMKKNVAAAKTEMDTRITAVRHYLNDFSQYLDFISQDIKNTGENFKQNM